MLEKLQQKQYKICSKCQLELPLSSFGINKYARTKIAYVCKLCNRDNSKQYKLKNPDKVLTWYQCNKKQKNISNKNTRKKYLDQWRQYCISRFGDPQCAICDKKLVWFAGDVTSSVNFDHRHGGTEIIRTKNEGHASVNNWLRSRPCNEKNITIFESCDFGLLCQRCNQFLPTINRLAWLEKATKYAKGL